MKVRKRRRRIVRRRRKIVRRRRRRIVRRRRRRRIVRNRRRRRIVRRRRRRIVRRRRKVRPFSALIVLGTACVLHVAAFLGRIMHLYFPQIFTILLLREPPLSGPCLRVWRFCEH